MGDRFFVTAEGGIWARADWDIFGQATGCKYWLLGGVWRARASLAAEVRFVITFSCIENITLYKILISTHHLPTTPKLPPQFYKNKKSNLKKMPKDVQCPPEYDDDHKKRTIFISGLSYETDEDTLRDFFTPFGIITYYPHSFPILTLKKQSNKPAQVPRFSQQHRLLPHYI
jgi:hypothetical protein